MPLGVIGVASMKGSINFFNPANFLVYVLLSFVLTISRKYPRTLPLDPELTFQLPSTEPIFNLQFGKANNYLASSSLQGVRISSFKCSLLLDSSLGHG